MDEFETKDRKMIITLMACGIAPKDIRKDKNTLFFVFATKETNQFVENYLKGEKIEVDIHAFWRAEDIFKSYLNGR
jgi:hypothetical protein